MKAMIYILAIAIRFTIDGTTITTGNVEIGDLTIDRTVRIESFEDKRILVHSCHDGQNRAVKCMEVRKQSVHRLFVYRGRKRWVLDNE